MEQLSGGARVPLSPAHVDRHDRVDSSVSRDRTCCVISGGKSPGVRGRLKCRHENQAPVDSLGDVSAPVVAPHQRPSRRRSYRCGVATAHRDLGDQEIVDLKTRGCRYNHLAVWRAGAAGSNRTQRDAGRRSRGWIRGWSLRGSDGWRRVWCRRRGQGWRRCTDRGSLAVTVGVAVPAAVAVGVLVGVGVSVAVAVAVPLRLPYWSELLTVAVAVLVGVGVSVAVAVAVPVRGCRTGRSCRHRRGRGVGRRRRIRSGRSGVPVAVAVLVGVASPSRSRCWSA